MKCSSPASNVTEPSCAVFMIQVAPPAPPPVLYSLPAAPGAVVIGPVRLNFLRSGVELAMKIFSWLPSIEIGPAYWL